MLRAGFGVFFTDAASILRDPQGGQPYAGPSVLFRRSLGLGRFGIASGVVCHGCLALWPSPVWGGPNSMSAKGRDSHKCMLCVEDLEVH